MFKRNSRNNQNNRNLVEGGLLKPILALALPTIAGNILQSIYNLVDIYFVSWIGTEAIAAVAVAGNAMWVISTAIMGLSIGSTALIARYTGANDKQSLHQAIVTTLLASVVVTIILAVIVILFGRPILRLLGTEPVVEEMAYQYLFIMLIFGFSMIFSFMINGILRGTGDAVTPMIIMSIGTVINLALDPLLILGIWIFPRWGVSGAAAATVIARFVTVIIAGFVLFNRHITLDKSVLKGFSMRMLKQIFLIGYPSSISGFVRSSAMMVLIALVAIYGTEAVAAYGIGGRLTSFILFPGFGFAAAAAILTGQNLGADKPRRAEKTAYAIVGMYAFVATIIIAAYVAMPRFWIGLFDTDPEVVRLGATFLIIVAPAYLATTVGLTLSRAMSGAGATLKPMLISAGALIGIRIPLALFLVYVIETGPIGVFWAVTIPAFIEAGAMFMLYRNGGWKKKKL